MNNGTKQEGSRVEVRAIQPGDRKPQTHLINILKSASEDHACYCLFLGAGASISSGVPSAGELVREWRERFWEIYGVGEDKNGFFRDQSWHDRPEEYSYLFETLYDQPSQRREFIESKLAGSSPSWGYIYLVNLLKRGVFNTVFTTNFDDLVNEACYLFSSDTRPIVCSHDSSIDSVRLTSPRPKVIKLHGDFLFDNIKNTARELETLEENMRRKFRQFAAEFGFIFVGYSGGDRSVMDALSLLLNSPTNFQHGIYWCIPKGSQVSDRVASIGRDARVHLIEIEGFDQFFAELHDGLGVPLQQEMTDPYQALSNRLNVLVDSIGLDSSIQKNEIIDRHLRALAHKLQPDIAAEPTDEGSIRLSDGHSTIEVPIPYGFLAESAIRSCEFEKAKSHILKELSLRKAVPVPVLKVACKVMVLLDTPEGRDEVRRQVLSRIDDLETGRGPNMGGAIDLALSMLVHEEYEIARQIFERVDDGTPVSMLNTAQVFVHKAEPIPEPMLTKLRSLELKDGSLEKMGQQILLGDYSAAEAVVRTQFGSENNRRHFADHVWQWPIVNLLKPHLDPSLVNEIDSAIRKPEVYRLVPDESVEVRE